MATHQSVYNLVFLKVVNKILGLVATILLLPVMT